MKVLIDKSQLINAVTIASRAVPVRSTSSILKCLLIDATSDTIRITGNDNELGIETSVEGIIQENGMIAVSADILSSIVRKLPEGMVSICSEGEKIEIRCEKVLFHILGMEGSEFVRLPEVEQKNGIEISQFSLREMITKTIFSVSSSETNILMTGELFEIKDNVLRVISLDGHRISVRRTPLKQSCDDRKCVIPGKALSEISKILSGDMERMTEIYITEQHAMFRFDQTIVVTRLIEGNYFDVDHMLSSDYVTHIRINRQSFLSCLERCTLLIREEDKKPVILQIRENEMEIRINSTLGSLNEVIEIEREGEDLTIGFNPRFLIDAFRAIDEEMADIYLMSHRAPAYIRNEDSYCYLVLPINFVNV